MKEDKGTFSDFLYSRVTRTSIMPNLVESHAHSRFEMYFLLSGECRYFIGNRIYRVPSHSIILIPRGVLHKTVYISDTCDRILLHFTGEYINPILAPKLYRFFPNYIYKTNEQSLAFVSDVFHHIEREYNAPDEFSKEMIKAYVTSLLTEIVRHSHENGTELFEKTNLMADDAIHYLNEHFRENVTLSMMAKRATVSESHFSRQFKNGTGYGFKEYINVLRIREAQRMLLNTNQSVCDIAFACGYNDSNYFSTTFKAIHNVSPLAFRNANRKY